MRTYRFAEPICGDIYRSVLDYASTECAFASLVVRRPSDLGSAGHQLIASLTDNLNVIENQSEWPGTRIMDTSATIYEIRLSAEVLERLKLVANCLHDWVAPDLPEDLAFLRADKTAWLASISHEDEAWLKLDEDEENLLRSSAPSWTSLLSGWGEAT
jgi:hypothetical protein